jgi:hypothetical protein
MEGSGIKGEINWRRFKSLSIQSNILLNNDVQLLRNSLPLRFRVVSEKKESEMKGETNLRRFRQCRDRLTFWLEWRRMDFSGYSLTFRFRDVSKKRDSEMKGETNLRRFRQCRDRLTFWLEWWRTTARKTHYLQGFKLLRNRKRAGWRVRLIEIDSCSFQDSLKYWLQWRRP